MGILRTIITKEIAKKAIGASTLIGAYEVEKVMNSPKVQEYKDKKAMNEKIALDFLRDKYCFEVVLDKESNDLDGTKLCDCSTGAITSIRAFSLSGVRHAELIDQNEDIIFSVKENDSRYHFNGDPKLFKPTIYIDLYKNKKKYKTKGHFALPHSYITIDELGLRTEQNQKGAIIVYSNDSVIAETYGKMSGAKQVHLFVRSSEYTLIVLALLIAHNMLSEYGFSEDYSKYVGKMYSRRYIRDKIKGKY